VPDKEYLNYIANYIDEDSDSRTRRTTMSGLQAVSELGRWQRTVGLNFQHERAFFDDDVADSDAFTDLLIPNITVSRIESDDELFARDGWKLSGTLRGSVETFLSDVRFIQAQASAKYIRQVGPGRVIARTDVGTTVAEDFERLPPSIQFYTGGDQTVRGYKFDSIHPGGVGGNVGTVPGGENLVVGGLEYEYPLPKKLSIAAFIDVGDSFNGSDVNLRRGIGVGLRWQLPFGSVRLDIARALDRDGKPVRVHLMIGPDF
jgi:translocation and assembly module TamA